MNGGFKECIGWLRTRSTKLLGLLSPSRTRNLAVDNEPYDLQVGYILLQVQTNVSKKLILKWPLIFSDSDPKLENFLYESLNVIFVLYIYGCT